MILNKEEILKRLRQIRFEIERLGIRKLGLFGSCVREEQQESSDMGLLVEFNPEAEKFDRLMELYDLLENNFPNEKVQIVSSNGLSAHIVPHILKEVEHV